MFCGALSAYVIPPRPATRFPLARYHGALHGVFRLRSTLVFCGAPSDRAILQFICSLFVPAHLRVLEASFPLQPYLRVLAALPSFRPCPRVLVARLSFLRCLGILAPRVPLGSTLHRVFQRSCIIPHAECFT